MIKKVKKMPKYDIGGIAKIDQNKLNAAMPKAPTQIG